MLMLAREQPLIIDVMASLALDDYGKSIPGAIALAGAGAGVIRGRTADQAGSQTAAASRRERTGLWLRSPGMPNGGQPTTWRYVW